MNQKTSSLMKSFLKSLVAIGLVIALAMGHADSALAARSGGRIGGGSFRSPSRTYAPPTRTSPGGYGGGYGGGYYPGGGFGFPFILPFIGGGGGGLFSVLIFLSIAGFLVQSFRRNSDGGDEGNYTNPAVSIAKVQVGLLAEARNLQAELDLIAEKANTNTNEGLAQVLQETTLSMLRHPEYWVYGADESQQARLESAEAQFNRLALSERSKFTAETLSNVNNQLKQGSTGSALALGEKGGALAESQDPGEYIVVTLIAATQGKLELPPINSSEDLRKALSLLGGISSDRLLALEILWTPQAEGDVLTRDDVIAEYPNLKLV